MYYPIGDVHGQYEIMVGLYNKIIDRIKTNPDEAFGDTIVFLGDYIDRGPKSKDVLDFLMNIEDTIDIKHIFLKGNHEEMMIDARINPYCENIINAGMWLQNGGEETLESFNLTYEEFRAGGADEYVNWINNLEVIHITFDYIFVHAAVDTNMEGNEIVNDEMVFLWGRHKPNYRRLNKFVVHGHVPRDKGPLVLDHNKEIFMDVGCGYQGNNRLATIVLPKYYDGEFFEIIDYVPT